MTFEDAVRDLEARKLFVDHLGFNQTSNKWECTLRKRDLMHFMQSDRRTQYVAKGTGADSVQAITNAVQRRPSYEDLLE